MPNGETNKAKKRLQIMRLSSDIPKVIVFCVRPECQHPNLSSTPIPTSISKETPPDVLLEVQAIDVDVDDDATPKLNPLPPDNDMTVDEEGAEEQKE